MSKYASRKKTEYVISEEVATDQVVELLDYYNIDVEALAGMGEAQDVAIEKALDAVRDAFRAGKLEISRDNDSKLKVVQHLSSGTTIEYREVDAKAKLAMEKFNNNAGYSRIYAFMGSLCGLGKDAIEKIPARDLSVVEVLGTVFLNA